MKTAKVTMLTTEDCRRCQGVETRLAAAAKRAGVAVDLNKIDCLSSGAIDIGIQYGFDDIPSMVVGKKGFCGESFSDDELVSALKAAAGAK